VRQRLCDFSPGLPARHDARIWRGVFRMESRGQELEMGSSCGLGRGGGWGSWQSPVEGQNLLMRDNLILFVPDS